MSRQYVQRTHICFTCFVGRHLTSRLGLNSKLRFKILNSVDINFTHFQMHFVMIIYDDKMHLKVCKNVFGELILPL